MKNEKSRAKKPKKRAKKRKNIGNFYISTFKRKIDKNIKKKLIKNRFLTFLKVKHLISPKNN